MNPLIVSAPFGNWFNNPKWSRIATPTLGTFTLHSRGGAWYRLWRILRTVRYYPGIGAWKNKLGLPNPGIGACPNAVDCIVSVSARSNYDWECVISQALDCGRNPLAIELNVSCPNTPSDHDVTDYESLFNHCLKLQWQRRHGFGFKDFEFIIKLPPVNYEFYVVAALQQGLRSFHCCNTLGVAGNRGGLSGKPLKPLSLVVVKIVHGLVAQLEYNDARIIGGGGITHFEDAQEYLNAGATNVAVASVLFNPLNWRRIRRIGQTLLINNQKGNNG